MMQLPVKKLGCAHFDTVIIGSGISGLACAQRLFESPAYTTNHSFVILEARNRIGGRIGTEIVNGARLDTGANWIHGTGEDSNPNPILKFVSDHKYKELKATVAFRCQDKADSLKMEQEPPDLVVPAGISAKLFASLWQLLGSLREEAEEFPPESSKNLSMLDAILKNEQFKRDFASIPNLYQRSLSGSPQMLEGMEAAPLNSESAEYPEDETGMSLAEFAINGFDGKQVFLRDGYISVINSLAKEVLSNDHVHLDTCVRGIRWDRSPLEITTNRCTYTARNIVCTIPLGVLKHQLHLELSPPERQRATFFSPALPPEKVEAISSLGFGTLDKIFMVYKSPWWKETAFYQIIEKGIMEPDRRLGLAERSEPDGFRGFTNELKGLHITPEGTYNGPCGLFLVNLHSLTGYPVLSAFVSCANARRIEGMSNQDAGAVVHRALVQWFGGLEPPKPDQVHVTRWAQDEFARGSYSHRITGKSERRHHDAFKCPLVNHHGNAVRFAGEHTSVEDFATAHGALLSGWREADAIVAEDSLTAPGECS